MFCLYVNKNLSSNNNFEVKQNVTGIFEMPQCESTVVKLHYLVPRSGSFSQISNRTTSLVIEFN